MDHDDRDILASAVRFWESRGVPRRFLYQAIISRELRRVELRLSEQENGDQKLVPGCHPGLTADGTTQRHLGNASSDIWTKQEKGVGIKGAKNELLSSFVGFWKERGIPKRYVYEAIIKRDIEETERRNEVLRKQYCFRREKNEKQATSMLSEPSTNPVMKLSFPTSSSSHFGNLLKRTEAVENSAQLPGNFINREEKRASSGSAQHDLISCEEMYHGTPAVTKRKDRKSPLQRLSDVALRFNRRRKQSIEHSPKQRVACSDSGLATSHSVPVKRPHRDGGPEMSYGFPENLRHEPPTNPQLEAATSDKGRDLSPESSDGLQLSDDSCEPVTNTGKVERQECQDTSEVSILEFGVTDTRLFDDIPFIDDEIVPTKDQDEDLADDYICAECIQQRDAVSLDVFEQTVLPQPAVTFPSHKPKRRRVIVKAAFQELHEILRGVRRFVVRRLPCLVR